jgi:carboxypeptidase C (cathepsin A)
MRQAIVKNPTLKILVMEGYYDLATPYYAANYTVNHLNLPQKYRTTFRLRLTMRDTWFICQWTG